VKESVRFIFEGCQSVIDSRFAIGAPAGEAEARVQTERRYKIAVVAVAAKQMVIASL
jgi:hypothetical protein